MAIINHACGEKWDKYREKNIIVCRFFSMFNPLANVFI